MSLQDRSEILDSITIKGPRFTSVHGDRSNTLTMDPKLGFSCQVPVGCLLYTRQLESVL